MSITTRGLPVRGMGSPGAGAPITRVTVAEHREATVPATQAASRVGGDTPRRLGPTIHAFPVVPPRCG